MKRILFFLAVVSMGVTNARGQCPIPCDKEAFPYYFCDPLGNRHLKCSTDPQSDTANGWKPVLTHIPGCVNVAPIDPSLDFQPAGPVPIDSCGSEPYPDPVPLDRYTFFEDYVSHILNNDTFWQPAWNYSSDDPVFGGDSAAYAVWCEQWFLDSGTFVNGDIQETAPYDPSDPEQISIIDNAGQQDYYFLWYSYAAANSEYETEVAADATWAICDSTFHAQNDAGTNVPYEQVWNDGEASSDAQDGLNSWLALCHLQGDPNCCIYIEPDNNINNWQGNYDPAAGSVHFHLGVTHGTGSYCSDGSSCPDHNYRFISYNATNSFFYANNSDNVLPNPAYILHPSPINGWYTGTVTPAGSVYTNYSDYSFREMVEHEIGHFLGLNHPEQTADDGSTCPNNQTQCPNSLDQHMLMSDEGIGVDNPPFGIQPDDACMFQKLYCPGTGYDGVTTAQQVPEPPCPEIFPNPTTGACQLQYELLDRAFVQVAIYDVLGNQMRLISSDYEEPGTRTISLGTESLPSGHYVCRVRVGENVTYINVVVER